MMIDNLAQRNANKRSNYMKKELDEIIEKYDEGNMSLIALKTELLRLFAVSGSALQDKVVKQIPNEYKEQVSKTIKKHFT